MARFAVVRRVKAGEAELHLVAEASELPLEEAVERVRERVAELRRAGYRCRRRGRKMTYLCVGPGGEEVVVYADFTRPDEIYGALRAG